MASAAPHAHSLRSFPARPPSGPTSHSVRGRGGSDDLRPLGEDSPFELAWVGRTSRHVPNRLHSPGKESQTTCEVAASIRQNPAQDNVKLTGYDGGEDLEFRFLYRPGCIHPGISKLTWRFVHPTAVFRVPQVWRFSRPGVFTSTAMNFRGGSRSLAHSFFGHHTKIPRSRTSRDPSTSSGQAPGHPDYRLRAICTLARVLAAG